MLVHAGAERNVCNTVVYLLIHNKPPPILLKQCVKTDINSFVNSEDPNQLASSETT